MKHEGFEAPNTTPVPDIVFDKLLKELTGNELKVLLYIIRRTYGFGKNADAISLSQFRRGITTKDKKVLDSGCGLEHNRTILVALASLEEKGYVIANKGQTNSGDADTTIYKLRFKVASKAIASERVVTSSNYVVTPGNEGSYPTSPPWLPQVTRVVTPGNPQETVIQQTDSQETDRQEERVASPHVDVPHAFSENDNHSYRHDHTRKEDDWACNNWRGAHEGKTCADYQAYIDSGEREETPTEPRTPAIQMGAPDGRTSTQVPGESHRQPDHRGLPTDLHLPAETQGQVAIASIPGEAASPLAAEPRQSRPSPGDGAATGNSSEPRASDEKPLTLKEDEPVVRPETLAQRKRRIEAREKEIWVLVEAGLRTKFTKTHRQLKANTTGMERLIEDETNDEIIKTGLDRLSDFWKNQFDLAMFHAKLPGLVREQTPQRSGKLADKSPQSVRDVQYEAALQKIGQSLDEEVPAWLDFDNYVGNGPEERQRLVEEGHKLKAQGFCPDL